MDFDEAMKEAALAAERAVDSTTEKYNSSGVIDEPELSAYFIGQLDAELKGQVGNVFWSSTILRNGKGVAAEEDRVGADILLHVSVNSPIQKYSKGVLTRLIHQGALPVVADVV